MRERQKLDSSLSAVTRLVSQKGIDLLVEALPEVTLEPASREDLQKRYPPEELPPNPYDLPHADDE